MSTAPDHAGDLQRTRSCATELVCRKCELRSPLADGGAFCPRCGKSLDVDYDYELAAQRIRETPMDERPLNIWFLEELLPIHDAIGPGARGRVRGLHAPDPGRPAGRRSGAAQPLPQGRQHLPAQPLLQGPRRRAWRWRACWSSAARRSGASRPATSAPPWRRWPRRRGWRRTSSTPTAWRAPRPMPAARSARRCARWRATTTKPTKPAARSRKRRAWSSPTSRCAPSTPRAPRPRRMRSCSSSAGARPDRIVSPAAGGTLSSRIHKGLQELEKVGLAQTAHTKIDIAQPEGCNADRRGDPRAAPRRSSPCKPTTQAHSLGIGSPGDGVFVIEAVASRGGTAASVSDKEIFAGIDLLAATEGLLTEPAGGTTVAVAEEARRRRPPRPRRDGGGDDHRQRAEDPVRAPRQAVAVEGECNTETMRSVLEGFQREAGLVPASERLPTCRAYHPRGGTPRRSVLIKFWLHISSDEQLARFEARANDPIRPPRMARARTHRALARWWGRRPRPDDRTLQPPAGALP